MLGDAAFIGQVWRLGRIDRDSEWVDVQSARPHSDMTNRANPTTEVFPDKPGPVIRYNADGERELVNLASGMPSPPTVTNGRPDYGVTNIRNLDSPHWRGWTGVKNRCLVPWTAFCANMRTRSRRRPIAGSPSTTRSH
ncbi:hypothetical protein [Sinorhizobium sp. 22678]|uniref:hypothetical protein n=1 Tax=Sinorhizobium sp. 22678 TaxID=3453955 RepID=UPI003F85741E